MTLKVHFDGKVFVPDEPVNLPTGATGEVVVTTSSPDAAPSNGSSLVAPVIVGIDPELGRAIAEDPEFDIENS